MDFGCMAPVRAFSQAFAAFDMPLTDAQIRVPMGSAKRAHIEAILTDAEVAALWRERHGAPATQDDIDRIYAAFLEADERVAMEHCDLIPGAQALCETLRGQGILIGGTTGYPGSIIERIHPRVAEQGFLFDTSVTASDVRFGRPAPDMCQLAAQRLGIADPAHCLVVDDTLTGIDAGRAAGMWVAGVSASGNEMGLSLPEWEALPERERAMRLQPVRARMLDAGAHFVIESVARIEPLIAAINARLAEGDRP